MAEPDHQMHQLFESVRDSISGVCEFCAGAFHVKDKVESSDIPLLDEYDGHPSLRNLVTEGYAVLIF